MNINAHYFNLNQYGSNVDTTLMRIGSVQCGQVIRELLGTSTCTPFISSTKKKEDNSLSSCVEHMVGITHNNCFYMWLHAWHLHSTVFNDLACSFSHQ